MTRELNRQWEWRVFGPPVRQQLNNPTEAEDEGQVEGEPHAETESEAGAEAEAEVAEEDYFGDRDIAIELRQWQRHQCPPQ